MFASRTDLEERYGQDLVLRLSASEADPEGSAAIARALADAQGLIEAKLATRFTLPLPSTPPLVARIACDLALHALALSGDQLTELIAGREKAARGDLRDLAEGRMNLGLPTPGGAAGPRPQPIVGPAKDRLFTRDSMRAL